MAEKFNQSKYQNEWIKTNMRSVSAKYKKEFVEEFKEACTTLNLKQSDVFRDAMQQVINNANQVK